MACSLLIGAAGAFSTMADSWNILLPYWMSVSLLLLLCVAIRNHTGSSRRRRFAHVASLLLVLHIAFAALMLGPVVTATPSAQGERPAFTLISFNMFKANPDPDAIRRWIESRNPDLLVLLEVSPANRAMVAQLRSTLPHQQDCALGKGCTTMLLSRHGFQDVESLALGDANNRQALSALRVRLDVGGLPLVVIALHQDRPWPMGKAVQHRAWLEARASGVGPSAIIAGDFNTAPWTFAARRLGEASGTRPVSGFTPSWPAGGGFLPPLLPLDQVHLGRCLGLVGLERGPDLGSDHRPLVARIERRACDA